MISSELMKSALYVKVRIGRPPKARGQPQGTRLPSYTYLNCRQRFRHLGLLRSRCFFSSAIAISVQDLEGIVQFLQRGAEGAVL